MTHVQVVLASWAGALTAVALFAGWREWRRARRVEMDAVGLMPWQTIQVLAVIGLAICGLLALAR